MKKNSKLSWQVLKRVLIVHGLVAFLLTMSQIWIDYKNQIESIEKHLESSYNTFGPSLSESFYNADTKMINQIFQGMLSQPDYLGVALYDKLADRYTLESKIQIELDKKELRTHFDKESSTFRQLDDKEIIYYQHSLSIIDGIGNKRQLGSMIVFSHENIAFERIKSTIIFIFFNSLIKATVLVLMFMLVFNRLLLKPLEKISNVVSKINSHNLATLRLNLNISEDNEFRDLENRFNHLLDSLYKSQSKISSLNEELNNLNENLELKVEEKVKENMEKDKLLFQQSKMASMGEMLGNIAHQWRQPLSAISTASTGTKIQKEMDCLSDEQLYSALTAINKSAQYLSTTIDDFRNFLNPSSSIHSEFKISYTVDKALNLIKEELNEKDIKIIKNIENISIISIENELIQVIINILNNAKDVLVDVKVQKKYIFINVYEKEKQLVIEIKDNANGVPINIIDRVFEPYFTTKHKSQGTGIGLYMSGEIIKNHLDGNITVSNETYTYESIEYTGAKFTIEISID